MPERPEVAAGAGRKPMGVMSLASMVLPALLTGPGCCPLLAPMLFRPSYRGASALVRLEANGAKALFRLGELTGPEIIGAVLFRSFFILSNFRRMEIVKQPVLQV